MRSALSLVLWAALLAPPVAAQGQPEPGPSITVTGEGAAAVAPDMATIRLGVTTEAKSAAAALSANSAAMAEVLGFLAAEGIEGRDIQTSGLSLTPRQDDYRSGSAEPAVVGFVARNSVAVRVRDLGKLGGLLDRVVAEGANRFDGLEFGLSDPAEAVADARRKAVADARTRAETFAGAAGLALGPIRTITDQSGGVQPMDMRMMMAEAAPGVPIAAGEVTLRASVTVTWALAP